MATDIQIPDLRGKLAIVAGGSDGIGFIDASRLAEASGEVMMTVRVPAKGDAAAERIRRAIGNRNDSARSLDLSSLDLVAALPAEAPHCRPADPQNNAGVMQPPN